MEKHQIIIQYLLFKDSNICNIRERNFFKIKILHLSIFKIIIKEELI